MCNCNFAKPDSCKHNMHNHCSPHSPCSPHNPCSQHKPKTSYVNCTKHKHCSSFYAKKFYRSSNMTTTTVYNGSWKQDTSYTNLFSDPKLTNKIGKYTQTFFKSSEGGVYLFTGNFCLNDDSNSFISFQDNNIYIPNKSKFVEPVVAAGGKYLGKNGVVKTLLGKNVVEHTYYTKI